MLSAVSLRMASGGSRACTDDGQRPVYEILIFMLDDHRYGLSTACVQKLIRAVRAVAVPNPISGIESVIDLHGQIVPVIDLRHRLRLQPKEPQATEHLIIVRVANQLVAMRADRATDVRQIEPEMVQEISDAFDGGGVIRMPDGLVTMLDARSMTSGALGERWSTNSAAGHGK